jgi:hypothetical protein
MLRITPHGLGADVPGGGVPMSLDLQAQIRNIPACFTALEASRILDAVAETVRKAGAPLSDYQPAIDAANVWRGKIPWFSSPKFCHDTQEYRDLVAQITQAYTSGSATIGEDQVRAEARKQLAQDLTHPTLPNIPSPVGEIPLTTLLIGGAAILLLTRR